jgi:hypothetical protein
MNKSKSKKPSAAKSKTRKPTAKKDPVRDLDVSELESRRVKGGAIYKGIRQGD